MLTTVIHHMDQIQFNNFSKHLNCLTAERFSLDNVIQQHYDRFSAQKLDASALCRIFKTSCISLMTLYCSRVKPRLAQRMSGAERENRESSDED